MELRCFPINGLGGHLHATWYILASDGTDRSASDDTDRSASLRCRSCQTSNSRASIAICSAPLRSSRSQPDRQSPWTLTILLPHSATFIFLIQEHPLLLEVSIASRGLLLQLMWCDPAASILRLLARFLSRSRRFVKCNVLWSSLQFCRSDCVLMQVSPFPVSLRACVRGVACQDHTALENTVEFTILF